MCIRDRDTFENTQWRKVTQMQPMWLCFLWSKQFESALENTQNWTNVINVVMNLTHEKTCLKWKPVFWIRMKCLWFRLAPRKLAKPAARDKVIKIKIYSFPLVKKSNLNSDWCHPNPIERNSYSSVRPSVRNVFYPSKFGAFYVYFQPVSPARTAWF